jgi:hypothetical protein
LQSSTFEIDLVFSEEPATGPHPTIVSYNAGAVKIYNGMSSLVRFENKNIFYYT